ncbi:MAG: DUF4010 domain-containing protein [Campylobacterales bacterium]
MDLVAIIPDLLENFLLVGILSFLLGLEQREYNILQEKSHTLGSTRTYTFTGILGYILYIIDPSRLFYLVGLILLSLYTAIYYHRKSEQQPSFGIISILTLYLTYLIAPVALLFEKWFLFTYVVTILLVLNSKKQIARLIEKIDNEEIMVLAKFLILSGIILPLLPKEQIQPWLPVTWYQAWLAVVVISSISYAGYLVQTYFFKNRGFLFIGVFGGIYSSTATTVVLSKKSHSVEGFRAILASAIVIASAMMYFRLLAIVAIFNQEIFYLLVRPFLLLGLLAFALSFFLYRMRRDEPLMSHSLERGRNPLEIQAAFLFGFLFVAISGVTHFIIEHYGDLGLQILSVVVGMTDIDPFILSMLQGRFAILPEQAAQAILMAVVSNNFLKALYAIIFSRRDLRWLAAWPLIVLSVVTLLFAFNL